LLHLHQCAREEGSVHKYLPPNTKFLFCAVIRNQRLLDIFSKKTTTKRKYQEAKKGDKRGERD